MDVQQNDELGMEFRSGMQPFATEIYLRASEGAKKTDFIAEISHGVTVATMSTPIQGWIKGAAGTPGDAGTPYQNTMSFGKEVDLTKDYMPELTLIRSKSNMIMLKGLTV